MMRVLFLSTLVFIGYYFFYPDPVIEHPDGILVQYEPWQGPAPNIPSWEHKGYVITPRASFALKARVLSRKRYYTDGVSSLVPYDFVLGWKEMSDSSVLRRLTIKQYIRLYVYRGAFGRSLTQSTVAYNSANMHMIPATGDVKRTMSKVRKGSLIALQGILVDYRRGTKEYRTSTSRADTGLGACEIIWVTKLAILD